MNKLIIISILLIGVFFNVSDCYAGKIHKAAKRGNVELIKTLIEAGADLNKTARFGDMAPLHLAAKNGHANVVALLIKNGADVGIRTKKKLRALYFAAEGGSYDVVKQLLNTNVKMELGANDYNSPIHLSSKNGDVAITEMLILKYKNTYPNMFKNLDQMRQGIKDEIANWNVVDATKRFNERIAGIEKNPDLDSEFKVSFIKDMRQHGVRKPILKDLENLGDMMKYNGLNSITGFDQDSPLQLAATLAHVGAIRLLLANQINVEARYDSLFAQKLAGLTALQIVAFNAVGDEDSYLEIAKILLKAGASKAAHRQEVSEVEDYRPSAYRDVYSWQDALSKKNYRLSALVKYQGPKPDDKKCEMKQDYDRETRASISKKKKKVNNKKNGRSHLIRATEYGLVELVDFLLENGANVALVNKQKKSALHIASQLGYMVIVRSLLAREADPNCVDKFGKTCLHNARANCISLLINAGSEVNALDKNGWTPLHWAVHWADVDRVRELLKAGADPKIKNKIKNKEGHIPLWFISRDYKTFTPGEFTKPIVDMLKNPALANQVVATTSTATTSTSSSSNVTSTSTTVT